MVVWQDEKKTLRRDAEHGMYKLSSFFAAKTLVVLPFEGVFVLIVRFSPEDSWDAAWPVVVLWSHVQSLYVWYQSQPMKQV